MNVNKVNIPQPQVRKSNKYRTAKEGALVTSGILTASTGATWIKDKPYMQQVVKDCGGKGKYAANFIIGLTVFSAAGAIVNTALNAAVRKVHSKNVPNSPKAAN